MDWNEALDKHKGKYVMLTMTGTTNDGNFVIYGKLAEVYDGFIVITSEKPNWKPLAVNSRYIQTFRECKKPDKKIQEESVLL